MAAVHVTVFWLVVAGETDHVRIGTSGAKYVTVELHQFPIKAVANRAKAESIAPTVDLAQPPILKTTMEIRPIAMPSFVVAEEESSRGSELRAPQIDSSIEVDATSYARKAGMLPGARASVLMAVLVDANGNVVKTSIVKSSGDYRIDQAASDYARVMHWIPGSIDGEPRAMQTQVTIVLEGVA